MCRRFYRFSWCSYSYEQMLSFNNNNNNNNRISIPPSVVTSEADILLLFLSITQLRVAEEVNSQNSVPEVKRNSGCPLVMESHGI